MLVIVAPGQGAQTPGFLAPWLESPDFADRLHWLSAVAGLDLAPYGTEADADTIRDTAVAQPLLVAAGTVSLLELFRSPPTRSAWSARAPGTRSARSPRQRPPTSSAASRPWSWCASAARPWPPQPPPHRPA